MYGELNHGYHSGLGPKGFCICPKHGYRKVHTP